MFEFQDPCGDYSGAGGETVAAQVEQPGFVPNPSREDLPIAWAFADAGGGDYRGILDRQTLLELQASAASGDGIRTLYGAGGPPPPADAGGNGSGGRDGGAGSEIMSLIGAGFLYAAVERVLNKDKTDNAQALLFAVLGGGLIYYGRKG